MNPQRRKETLSEIQEELGAVLPQKSNGKESLKCGEIRTGY
jgi:hypothetical protein